MRHDDRKQQGESGQAQRGQNSGARGVAATVGESSRASSGLKGHSYAAGAALTTTERAASFTNGDASRGQDTGIAAAADLIERHGATLASAAARAGVPESALAAVVLTEAAQLGSVVPGALAMRFEPFVFWQQTGQWVVATHRDQAAERGAFAEACNVDASAAHVALRMGLAQLSGAEASAAGFADAVAMRAAFEADPTAQIEAIATLASADGALHDAMVAEHWSNLAALRAGPAYHAVGYDDALHASALAWSELRQAEGATADAHPASSARYGGGDEGPADGDDKPRRKRSAASRSPKH
jgi:hypothetical protein